MFVHSYSRHFASPSAFARRLKAEPPKYLDDQVEMRKGQQDSAGFSRIQQDSAPGAPNMKRT